MSNGGRDNDCDPGHDYNKTDGKYCDNMWNIALDEIEEA